MSKGVSIGDEAYLSDEFRVFAVKWLGFDPQDVESREMVVRCAVIMSYNEVTRYHLTVHAEKKLDG